MKTLPKLILSILLLSTLTAHAVYVSNLFGVYEQEANRARYENTQDAYYGKFYSKQNKGFPFVVSYACP